MANWRAHESAEQARRREQNEVTARARTAEPAVSDDRAFRCECGDAECRCEITLKLSEYELVRGHATHFAIARNHENPERDHVVRENARFAIVETVAGEATKLARRSDPRQRRREALWSPTARPGKPGGGRRVRP